MCDTQTDGRTDAALIIIQTSTREIKSGINDTECIIYKLDYFSKIIKLYSNDFAANTFIFVNKLLLPYHVYTNNARVTDRQ